MEPSKRAEISVHGMWSDVRRWLSRTVCLGLVATAGCHTSDRPAEEPHEPVATTAGEANERAAAAQLPASAVETPKSKAAHLAVQQRLGVTLAEHPQVHFVPVEDPSGRAFSRFHEGLRKLETASEGEAPRKVRIAFYGSSSVAADRYTSYLRGYLQHRFGDGGIGFVSLVPLWRWHRHNEVTVEASSSWTIEHAQKEKTGRLDGLYGLLGASAHTSSKRARASLRARAGALSPATNTSRMELWYLRQPDGGRFTVTMGGKPVGTVATAAEAPEPGYFVPDPMPPKLLPLEVRPKGDGEVRLFGAVLETEGSGVVLDNLGIGGTRAANHLGWVDDIWIDNLEHRAPDLYVLAYGANEAVDEDEPIELYRESLVAVLDRFAKAAPGASCLLIGPVDFPVLDETTQQWKPRDRIDRIIAIQREVAAAKHCGFWDTRAFMGGPGSMDAWVASDPPLAKDDHLHYTTLGYLYMGRTLVDAIMSGYDGAGPDGLAPG